MLDRRTVIGGFAATAVPVAVGAQTKSRPVIGFLGRTSPEGWEALLAGLHRGLKDGGFVDGQNVSIEYRWAEGRNERLPALAAELVARKVDVIVSAGGAEPALALKAETTTIPVVFSIGPDPVGIGLVQSLSRPGGNLTGFTLFASELGPKRLEFLRELVPGNGPIGVLLNPDAINAEGQRRDLGTAAKVLGERIEIVDARGDRDAELDAAFETFAARNVRAMIVGSDPLYFAQPDKVVARAARYRLPASYESRVFAVVGGLMSYGVSFPDIYRQVGLYTARILKGDRPADMPVHQPTRFEFVINAKTATTLGLTIPPTLLGFADEVIE